ncbi:hypothetical protein H4S14_004322 [Agrobacterium vitis]|nr:hypothetical protein [Agrobacterium vitis]MBE1440541.1 hypothetical protein [Agrobacterium vitis]
MSKILAGKNVSIDLDEDAPAAPSNHPDNAVIDLDGGTSATSDIVDEDGDPRDRLPDRAVINGDGSVTLPLLFPQTLTTKKDGKVRDKLFDALTFHRMRGADQMAISAVPEEKQIAVAFARSTRMAQMVMDKLYEKMDLADITDAGRVLNHFLTSGRKTGR